MCATYRNKDRREFSNKSQKDYSDKLNYISYLRISDFHEAYRSNIKTCSNMHDFMKIVDENKKTPDKCVFEVLNVDNRRLYFDIENIPNKSRHLIYDLIRDLSNFLGVDKQSYVLTINKGSRHPGLSYHLLFPYKTYANNILNLVRNFKLKYSQYKNYIDECVYNHGRLFRLPNQFGIGNSVKGHFIKNKKYDVHHIVKGKFQDFIIQNTEGLPELDKNFDYIPKYKLRNTHLSPIDVNNENNYALNLAKDLSNKNHEALMENVSLIKDLTQANMENNRRFLLKDITFIILIFVIFVLLMIQVVFNH